MRIVYFAWVRERIGREAEEIDPPPDVTTVAELIAWLRGRGGGYADALADPRVVRVALDRRHAAQGATLAGAREIALFPPMTGG